MFDCRRKKYITLTVGLTIVFYIHIWPRFKSRSSFRNIFFNCATLTDILLYFQQRVFWAVCQNKTVSAYTI